MFMSRFKKLSHTIYQSKYHVVWIPKYRFHVMTGEIRYYVRDAIRRLCEWKKLEIIQGNVKSDHIHLVLWIPPNRSVSSTIGFLKGKSALKIFDRFPQLKKRYWNKHFWSPGYCVSTVGLDEEKIVKYVRWQQKKDREIEELGQQNLFAQ